ncbi:hypothetical protein RHSIM_Rhsim12G0111500 [Rhododendron simsii]|uniref:Protein DETOXIFICATION n=1 Tax=Rhododendron simsii TaxID=118357 RepID=A0A834G4I7_RHOSS|nr:hypothetical protein RHSIM_Rhsim12G0111500 [Rhododendron simsii]
MENGEQPLLSSIQDDYHNPNHNKEDYHVGRTGIHYFFREFSVESKKLWYLAAPAILTSICQYSLGAITQVFAGQLGTTELAMVSVENSIIAGFCYGIMNAQVMSDASSICVNIMGWTIMAGNGFNSAISVRVSNELGAANPRAAKFSAMVVGVTSSLIGLFLVLVLVATAKQYPSLFSTDTQVKEIVYELTPLLGLAILVYNLQLSLAGMLLLLKTGYNTGVKEQMICSSLSSSFPPMENGEQPLLSQIKDEYHNSQIHDPVGSSTGIQYFFRVFFVESKKLWYLAAPAIFTSICQYSLGAITQVFAGQLGTTELAMVSVENSIIAGFCYGIMIGSLMVTYTLNIRSINILGWTIMAGNGFNAAVSVRVSNELGAAQPRAAKFSAVVVGVTSTLIGLFLALVLIVSAKQYPSFFSTDAQVKELVYELTPLLGVAILVYNLQFALAGTGGHWGRVASLRRICEPGVLLFGWDSNVSAYGFQVQHGDSGTYNSFVNFLLKASIKRTSTSL